MRGGRGTAVGGLAVAVIPCVIVSMDLSVLFLAAPAIARALHPTSDELLWIADIYGLFIAGLLIAMGNLADRIGAKRLLMIGSAAFAVFSAASAFATTPLQLIIARALLGCAGATLMPSTLALIRQLFPDEARRRTALAVWTAGFAGGGVLGPVVGGLLLQHLWWGSVFLINVPVMGALLILGPFFLPKRVEVPTDPIDWPSVALLVGGCLGVAFAITRIASVGPSIVSAAAGVGAVGLAVLFVRRQRSARTPLIDIELFRLPRFRTPLLINSLTALVSLGIGLLVAQYLQLVLGLSPLTAGLWMLPGTAALVLGSTLAARLAARLSPLALIVIGLAFTGAGLGILVFVGSDQSPAFAALGGVLDSIGFGVIAPVCVNSILSSVTPDRAGAASGISETGGEFGASLGIAVFGSIAGVVYRLQLGASAPPGVTGAALDRATAGLAVALDGSVDGPAGTALAHAARAAFLSGFHLVALIAAGIVVVLAIVALREGQGRDADSDQTAR